MACGDTIQTNGVSKRNYNGVCLQPVIGYNHAHQVFGGMLVSFYREITQKVYLVKVHFRFYFNFYETKVVIYIVTEPVMPLAEKIKELGLEGTQRYTLAHFSTRFFLLFFISC